MSFVPVDKPELLEWMKQAFKLADKVEGGDGQLFGPFPIHRRPLHVRYDPTTDVWEIVEYVDDYHAAFPERKGRVIELAEEHRGSMEPAKFVQFLIQAAIVTGIDRRADILETVEWAANWKAVKLSIDTDADYESIPTQFDAAFVKAVFDRGRSTRKGRGLWWVDSDKTYHLN
jgi:hypothetical protein